jgi:hypothetical protein
VSPDSPTLPDVRARVSGSPILARRRRPLRPAGILGLGAALPERAVANAETAAPTTGSSDAQASASAATPRPGSA